MPQTFDCPSCSGTVSAEVPPGSEVECPLCREAVIVPAFVAPDGFPEAEPASMCYATADSIGWRSSNAAFGALVCGLVSVVTGCFPLGIVGSILGVRSLNQCKRQPSRYKGRGMAIAGVCLGCASLVTFAIVLSADIAHRNCVRNVVCAANLRGIGQAMYIYAQDEPGVFPAIGPIDAGNTGAMRVFGGAALGQVNPDRLNAPTAGSLPSPTVDMWAVVRAGNATVKQFLCPKTRDTRDPVQNAMNYYDFAGAANLSYAYQYQHDADRRLIGTLSEPSFPFMADANPYIKGGVTGSIQADRLSQSRGNSANHSNREGQNVLYQDGHVMFEKGPDCGLSGRTTIPQVSRARDNIYTTHTPGTSVDPGSAAPTAKVCNLGSRSDACLVP